MSGRTSPLRSRAARVLAYAVIGGLIALAVGLAAVVLAPEDGFGDLAAAAVTRVVLVPAGILIGGVFGWTSSRR